MKTKVLLEGALMIALTAVLEILFTNLNLALFPNGGSISISMIPFLVFSIRHGWKMGLVVSLIFGIFQFILPLSIYFLTPVQYLFDYVLPYAVLPVIAVTIVDTPRKIFGWTLLVGLLKYTSHVIAGVAFWGEYAPEGFNAWTWSLFYNATYSVPSTIIVGLIMAILVNKYKYLLTA